MENPVTVANRGMLMMAAVAIKRKGRTHRRETCELHGIRLDHFHEALPSFPVRAKSLSLRLLANRQTPTRVKLSHVATSLTPGLVGTVQLGGEAQALDGGNALFGAL